MQREFYASVSQFLLGNFFVLKFHFKKWIDKVDLVYLVSMERANNTRTSLNRLNYHGCFS